jgi:hypothetical protein
MQKHVCAWMLRRELWRRARRFRPQISIHLAAILAGSQPRPEAWRGPGSSFSVDRCDVTLHYERQVENGTRPRQTMPVATDAKAIRACSVEV